MLEAFERKFGGPSAQFPSGIVDPASLCRAVGDQMFGNGLYRVLSDSKIKMLEPEVFAAFPDFNGLVKCFAVTWMGDIFALRKTTEQVVIFEAGTAEALKTNMSFSDFHRNEMVNHADAALNLSFFREWTGAGNTIPALDQCVGYHRPLFQGGADKIQNLEITDLDVYWTVTAPYIAKARKLIV